jgi:hypothetical protein
MNGRQRKEEFLAKAKEAEQQAERTADRHEKESWLRIAQSYRDLANCQ